MESKTLLKSKTLQGEYVLISVWGPWHWYHSSLLFFTFLWSARVLSLPLVCEFLHWIMRRSQVHKEILGLSCRTGFTTNLNSKFISWVSCLYLYLFQNLLAICPSVFPFLSGYFSTSLQSYDFISFMILNSSFQYSITIQSLVTMEEYECPPEYSKLLYQVFLVCQAFLNCIVC